jgi:hypothetical protein
VEVVHATEGWRLVENQAPGQGQTRPAGSLRGCGTRGRSRMVAAAGVRNPSHLWAECRLGRGSPAPSMQENC